MVFFRFVKDEDSEYMEQFVIDASSQIIQLINHLCIDAASTQTQLKQLALHVLGYCLFQEDLTRYVP